MTALLEREDVDVSPEISNSPSDARCAANRRNAQRSTGPKTEEGKEKSRRNALKHGLTGEGIVRPEEDEATLQEEIEKWSAELKPRNEIERSMVKGIVIANQRMDRALTMESTMRGAPNGPASIGNKIDAWKSSGSPTSSPRRGLRA